MTILLTSKTQKLLDKQMKTGLFDKPDDIVRLALQTLEQTKGEDYYDLDAETRDAIEQGEADIAQGNFESWAKVRTRLRKRFSR